MKGSITSHRSRGSLKGREHCGEEAATGLYKHRSLVTGCKVHDRLPVVWFCWRCARPLKAWKVQEQGVTNGLMITGWYATSHVLGPDPTPDLLHDCKQILLLFQSKSCSLHPGKTVTAIKFCLAECFMGNYNNTVSFLLPTARSSGTIVPWGARLNVARFGDRLWSKSNLSTSV